MTTLTFPNLSDSTSDPVEVVWPATLIIYAGEDNGWQRLDERYAGDIVIEVQTSTGFRRFPELVFESGVITPLNIPNTTVRVVARNLSNVTVEIHDAGSDTSNA